MPGGKAQAEFLRMGKTRNGATSKEKLQLAKWHMDEVHGVDPILRLSTIEMIEHALILPQCLWPFGAAPSRG